MGNACLSVNVHRNSSFFGWLRKRILMIFILFQKVKMHAIFCLNLCPDRVQVDLQRCQPQQRLSVPRRIAVHAAAATG